MTTEQFKAFSFQMVVISSTLNAIYETLHGREENAQESIDAAKSGLDRLNALLEEMINVTER